MSQSNRRTTKWRILVLGLLAVLLLASGVAAAQALLQTVERPRAVGAAGFTAAHVDGVMLRGTLGQPFVGTSRKDNVTLGHGFWHGGVVEEGYTVYLPLVLRNS